MVKTEFMGFRIEPTLQKSIIEIVKTNTDYKTITEFANRALHYLVANEEVDTQHCMSHPDYPDLVKLMGAIESKETKIFLFESLKQIQYSEISAVYSWLRRTNLANQ